MRLGAPAPVYIATIAQAALESGFGHGLEPAFPFNIEIITMLTRERPRMPARAMMPPPTHLPSLSDALARRAAIFGPFDLDEAPTPSLGLLARCAAAFRGLL